MTYFLINYLCISGVIVGGIVYFSEGWRRKALVASGYLFISIILLSFIYFAGPPVAKMVNSFFGREKESSLIACGGKLDEADAGLRHIMVGMSDSFQAGAGKQLKLRGWISSYSSRENPITARLIPRNGSKTELALTVAQENRPDVAESNHDPMLDRCGFHAECLLPKNLPLGKYRVVIQCRNEFNVDEFIPHCEVEVISMIDGIALDAPLERALAEKRQQEAESVTSPRPSPFRKVRVKKNKDD